MQIPGLKDCISIHGFLSKIQQVSIRSPETLVKECLARPMRTARAFTYKGKKFRTPFELYNHVPGLKDRITYDDFLDEIVRPPKKSRDDIEELIERCLVSLPVIVFKKLEEPIFSQNFTIILSEDDPLMAYLKIIGPREQTENKKHIAINYKPEPIPKKSAPEIELDVLFYNKTIANFSKEDLNKLRTIEARIRVKVH